MVKIEEGLVVSEYTFRDSDLLRSYSVALKYLAPKKFKKDIDYANELLKNFGDFGYVGRINIDKEAQDDIVDFIHRVLYDDLSSLAPKKLYFGSHQGDGSCIGYWKDED